MNTSRIYTEDGALCVVMRLSGKKEIRMDEGVLVLREGETVMLGRTVTTGRNGLDILCATYTGPAKLWYKCDQQMNTVEYQFIEGGKE